MCKEAFEDHQTMLFRSIDYFQKMNVYRKTKAMVANFQPTNHVTYCKGLPMGCIVVSHMKSPPVEWTPYFSMELEPLQPIVPLGSNSAVLRVEPKYTVTQWWKVRVIF